MDRGGPGGQEVEQESAVSPHGKDHHPHTAMY